MSDDKEEIKVIDRRRFDSEGKERNSEDTRPEAAVSGEAPSQANKKGQPQRESGSSNQETSTIDFSSFLMSFATQALMQLGEIDPPAGVSIPRDIRAAKQTIDILSMLEAKTKGNLDPGEASLMEDILHNLRITFVKVSSAKKGNT